MADLDDDRILRCTCRGTDVCERHTAELFAVCMAGNFGTVETLLRTRGEFIDVNTLQNFGPHKMRPLMLRSVCLRPQIVELLLSHPNIDVEATDSDGETALHYACLWIRAGNSSFDTTQQLIASATLLAKRCCDATVRDALLLSGLEDATFAQPPRIFEYLKGALTKSAAGVGKQRGIVTKSSD